MNTPDAPDPRKVAEAALDVFVYAPVGLALEAKELLPKLAERGRNQIVLARLGARFAMQKAEAEAEKLLSRLQPPDTTPADTTPAAAPPAAATAPAAATTATVVVESPAPTATIPVTGAPKTAKPAKSAKATKASARPKAPKAAPAGASGGLAIPGYDTLSASQIVPRLDALRPGELEAIRAHEVAHRGRRTILSRIAQLQG